MSGFLTRVLRVGEGKRLKAFESATRAVNTFEPEMEARSDEELRDRYQELREQVIARIEQGEDGEEALADGQAETFAIVREAGRRALGMRHFDVQIMGGFALAD